jgi:hypothetical protein
MLGLAVLSELPLTALRESDEAATEGPFIQLLDDPNAEVVFLVEMFPFRNIS